MTIKPSLLFMGLASGVLSLQAAEPADVKKVKQDIKQLEQKYQQEIQALKDKLEGLEESVEENRDKTDKLAIEVSQQGNRIAPNTYNPGIGVILNGKYLAQSPSDYEFSMPGFFLGEEAGPGESGLALGESEINFAANIDDKFYGSLTLAFGEETEVEEAFIQTTSLPHGLQLKAGRFFSGVGYLNSHHAHSDDFAYRPLSQQAFLGNNYGDAGIQLRWLAPTDLYWESGVEVFRGESFPAAGADNEGKGVTSLFSHIGGDIGDSSSWRAGVSLLKADVAERASDEEGGELFTGDSELWLLDFVWKWAPGGNSKNVNAKIQAEYFSRDEKGEFTDLNDNYHFVNSSQEGWYIQGIYQFMPQWRVGVRVDRMKADDLGSEFVGTILDTLAHKPKQVSLMIDWSNSEFSRIRLQYSQDETSPVKADLWTLQYVAAFGAHGSHAF